MFFSSTKELTDLKERLEDVERGLRKIKLEWEDSFDRLRIMASRIARQAKEKQDPTEEPDASVEIPAGDPNHAHLNPHQTAINQRLLARRARLTRPTQ
jgi:hypothetical protein